MQIISLWWFIKTVLLLYIVISPFLNHKDLWFLHHILFKISILILIIATSFIDMQLAIILTIAFLVMIVNTNKHEIMLLKNTIDKTMPPASAPIIMEEETIQEQHPVPELEPVPEIPDAYCPGHANPDLSGSILAHVASRIGPFEEFVNILSPEESLNNIQSNLF